MAVAYDAYSAAATTVLGGQLTWTHTPVGTPRGVIVFVHSQALSTVQVTSVTYAAVTMTLVQTLGHTSGEPAGMACYFLGTVSAAGATSIIIFSSTATGTSNKWGTAITVTAGANTTLIASVATATAAVATVSVTLGLAGALCFVGLGCTSGQASITDVAPSTGWTARAGMDWGNAVGRMITYDTVGTTDVLAGWTQSSDDADMVAIAIADTATAASIVGGVFDTWLFEGSGVLA